MIQNNHLKNSLPLSLYVHVPWCVKKCPYCDFNSHTIRDSLPEQDYLDQLIIELEQKQAFLADRPIETIFIGGGTPSLFEAKTYETLFDYIRKNANLISDAEITLEANPGTLEQQRFHDYYQIGINRLSLGIQSFQDHQLKQLGRIHDRTHALQAIEYAKQAGFTNFNLDLMFGLAQQSINEALSDLHIALGAGATHLSWYQLTVEPNTFFYTHSPLLPDPDTLWDMQVEGQSLLASKGYQGYEVSAYSKPGSACQHNLNYWRFGDYLGIGAGAHSKITHINHDGHYTVTRHWNIKNPQPYRVAKNKIAENKMIQDNELLFEFMLNALRLSEPLPLRLFTERTGKDLTRWDPILHVAESEHFLTRNHDTLTLTAHGKRYLNNLLELFLIV